MLPTNRSEFKQYLLRNLGAPVIEVNVSDDQLDDRIDEALAYYADYHFDATEKVYFKKQVDANTKAEGGFALPENIIGAVRIFDLGEIYTVGGNMFNLKYQIALNDLYTLTSQSMIPYTMAMMHLETIQQTLVGHQEIRFNRHTNFLHIDVDWNKVEIGSYLVVEAYGVLDPDEYTDVWRDRWLLRYATALVRRQWGTNLSKFEGLQLPGGVTFNGRQILDDANNEIALLEGEMINSYSLPVLDIMG